MQAVIHPPHRPPESKKQGTAASIAPGPAMAPRGHPKRIVNNILPVVIF